MATIKNQKNYENILKLSKIVVFRRGHYKNIIQHKNIIYLNTPIYEISSTMIREKIKNNEDVSNYLPQDVLKIIKAYNLYK